MRKFIGGCLIMASILGSHGSIAATVSPDTSTPSYRQGSMDRDAWEAWYGGLYGQKHEGAAYWAANRSKNPTPCYALFGMDEMWLSGCVEAQRRLASSDFLRKSDPQYWNGWNKKTPFVPGIPGETPQVSYCSDVDITNQLTELIERIQLPYGGGNIKVLRLYNYRPGTPCFASLIADNGLYLVTYGKRSIDGDDYVYVHLDKTGNISGS
jgi:hypothetical protein